ncbi:ABC transporter ATP-binding protein [Acinetobacter nectaris]|uniref:ATP-binding cassette domain-containing protein n=1 Tax=Acinetobacter nectaris TaxID=1219382 RepID=UPI001F452BD9|nr:ABC transporter ATP-binding protein [Acinetobacter nectaris]MCF9045901.1 hypothetical protein [Acinetobacter nectaris]
MYAFLISKNNGRFTITGNNGSGKITFLHEFKNHLGNKAVIIPTDLNNSFWKNDANLDHLSTDQRIKNILEEVLYSEESFILLDEWNANLDTKNKIQTNALINKISKYTTVAEITHHH